MAFPRAGFVQGMCNSCSYPSSSPCAQRSSHFRAPQPQISPTESLTKPFVSGAVWYKMTFLVKTSPMEGYGKSKQEWKIILTWLSGNESCPISGESKRITVWPTSNPIRCWKFLFHTTQRNLPSGGGCTGQDSSREKERNSLSDGCLN